MIDTTDNDRWARVQARTEDASDPFFYAVVTTGIFCRPSCPSRTPRPANVRFFDSATGATAAGFRPCRRCHPQAIANPGTSLMADMARFIRNHADQPLPLSRLAEEAGMSPFHFQRRFKAEFSISPRDYQAAERLTMFKGRLRDGENVLHATLDAGFGSTSRIYEHVDGGLGMTPRAYRAGGAGETIVHATRETVLGPLMMAATERGVCFVQFGETAGGLLAQLAAEFPRARLLPAGPEASQPLDDWMAALADHLAGSAPRPDLPLDLRGTAFQIKVWRFLLSVKPGDVVSYGEVAEAIAEPRAVRAAASACGANRMAVLIPCHRVLRADGGLGGYRWGIERKRALLDAERR
ncbi:bifunctional transcriptional regulator/O6-methylguanine-DNA methyltransferase [Sandarakinorhabdus cyanobacteriorum]|uniref:methylated-DNA--[protein]-cysteine S-methyltransferase n=1 Tax=Sandarakinorhabdus cyanobacteriorum TaxID=1981098 RepID=A0A255Z8Y6_9SPHN|nr:bifunctional DNA-binding transcriptional regulator/O6-methylguanine-DNA methyltransferase Ada [Sandarakinorhabdus cyanobacteriorum]OYQ37871.1 bifunctional transcriptional regulator/O6-methylguanine-DNA methyltransferase [Sandarakinorhabdus cyanobacteriorum]